eukprot:115652_1
MSSWKCDSCGLFNKYTRYKCQACFKFLKPKDLKKCYLSELLSPSELRHIYQKHTLAPKIVNGSLSNFTIEKLVNISPLIKALQFAIESLSLLVPPAIINNMINLSLNDAQIYIEHKAKQIHSNIKITYKDFSLSICREICLYSGSYSWDGSFWCIDKNFFDPYGNNNLVPLHKYTNMCRIAFFCDTRDVVYCKSDEFCYGKRYFVEIKIDSKGDEMWIGIIFNDIDDWMDYRTEHNQIAYYGGRCWTIKDLKHEFETKYHKIYQTYKNDKSLQLEYNIIKHKDNLDIIEDDYFWDCGLGNIQGRGIIKSEFLPYYESGDVIGILVDTYNGFVYFLKNGNLVWYNNDDEIKKQRCKVFGCTDDTLDTLIYERILWNEKREYDLKQQIAKLRKNKPNIDMFSSIPP